MTEETVQFDAHARRSLQQCFRITVLQWLRWAPLSMHWIVRCQHCLVFDDYGLRLAGCRVDLSLTLVAPCWKPRVVS